MTLKMKVWQKIKQKLRQRFDRWLEQRQPAATELTLRQHLLYVFPSAYGAWFVLLIILLYVFGSNYQNNLILLCAYLLLSLFCCCILAAFFNLYKLQLKTSPPLAVPLYTYASQNLTLSLALSHAEHKKMLLFSGDEFEALLFETLPELVQLELYPRPRGFYQLQRFKLESYYPFGLIRCWTYIQLQQAYWVYPTPSESKNTNAAPRQQILDQPDQLAPYLPGDPASSIDWKRLAKNPWQPVVRQNSESSLPALPKTLIVTATGAALELQLSDFCFLLHQYEQQGESYSLVTATGTIGPDQGQTHLHRCLQALALC